jgi:hypothetical protein
MSKTRGDASLTQHRPRAVAAARTQSRRDQAPSAARRQQPRNMVAIPVEAAPRQQEERNREQ